MSADAEFAQTMRRLDILIRLGVVTMVFVMTASAAALAALVKFMFFGI